MVSIPSCTRRRTRVLATANAVGASGDFTNARAPTQQCGTEAGLSRQPAQRACSPHGCEVCLRVCVAHDERIQRHLQGGIYLAASL